MGRRLAKDPAGSHESRRRPSPRRGRFDPLAYAALAHLRAVVRPGTAAFLAPNHPEVFTDWMLDKQISRRISPLLAHWATNEVVNASPATRWFALRSGAGLPPERRFAALQLHLLRREGQRVAPARRVRRRTGGKRGGRQQRCRPRSGRPVRTCQHDSSSIVPYFDPD